MIMNQATPYGVSNNIRDSSVSNSSNPAGNSSLAAYNSQAAKQKAGGNFGLMNNFMPSNLPSQLFNPSGVGGTGSNYAYDINLNAVNKSGGPATGGTQSSNTHGGRADQNDYDNNPKSIYMSNKSSHS
jgi:hypothetical protein